MAELEWSPPSAEEFNKNWVLPRTAHELLFPIIAGEHARQRYIMDRLKAGLFTAVARDHEYGSIRKRFEPVYDYYWKLLDSYGDDHFWRTGDETFHLQGYVYRFLDIRFPPDWFDSHSTLVAPGPPAEPAAAVAAQNTGGAPRKAWWDDLWIEMIRRIRADELKPESAAELQRTMLDWLGEQGFYPGEDTLKKTARKLFKYLQE